MSAYASSFGSLLPSLISSVVELRENANKDTFQSNRGTDEVKREDADPKHENKIHVKVQSASIDFGVVAGNGISLIPKQPRDFLSLADAVLFKLFLDFHGKKYTITRSFAAFAQLRKSLVKEFRMNDLIQGDQSHFSSTATAENAIPVIPIGESCHYDHQDSNKTSSDIFNDTGLSGFAKVQSLLLYHYCPLMEGWLKDVMDTIDVETSACLNNFFWEPLSDDENMVSFILCTNNINCQQERRRSSAISALSLSSIPEFGFGDEDY